MTNNNYVQNIEPVLPEVSIIIPVYKVEKYLQKCVDSILAQTFKDFECILVDDGSPDACPQICDEFAKKDGRVSVIHKKQNDGLPQARKSGFDASCGQYILFIDSDDWVECNMIETMYNKAINENCDMVICDLFINTDSAQTQYGSPELYDKIQIIKEILMFGKYTPAVWNKLVKRNLYEKTIFPVHNYIEDRVITIQTIFYAEKIGYVQDGFYHYHQNTQSICSSCKLNERIIDEYYNYAIIIRFLEEKNLISYSEPELSFRINSLKISFLKNMEVCNNKNLVEKNLIGLYPKSTEILFTKEIDIDFLDKLLLLCAIKNNPFLNILTGICLFSKKLLKIFYRLIIPGKIRMLIWNRKHRSNNTG